MKTTNEIHDFRGMSELEKAQYLYDLAIECEKEYPEEDWDEVIVRAYNRLDKAQEKRRELLYVLWEKAWASAKADPENKRVIVETGEPDPSAPNNKFGRYYMIDGAVKESCIEHAGQWVVIRVDIVTSPYEVRRPNYHYMRGYADNETQLCCRCENGNNITRWARLMIDAGRVTDIYADRY